MIPRERTNHLANDTARAIVKAIEAKTGVDLDLNLCFTIVAMVESACEENRCEACAELLARAEAAEKERDEAKSWARKFAEQRDDAESQAERMRVALEAVEWVRDGDGFNSCPWCVRAEHNGHKPDCQRQLALADAPAEEESDD